MKLLHVINDLNIGGAQKLVHDLLLIQNTDPDIQVSCFVFRQTGSELERNLISNGIQIISANSSPWKAKALRKLRHSMKSNDIVHAHLFPSNYITSLMKVNTNVKLVFTEHSTHNRRRDHKLLRPTEQFIYRGFDKIACISPATADNLSAWIGPHIAKCRIEIIENGIEMTRFTNAPYSDPKALFGRSGTPIIMISRFTASKDHPTLIRALKHIEDPNVFVVFIGDGERRNEIEDLVRNYDLQERVVFLGTRYDIPKLIKSSTIGIQSSNWEGFGLTAVEIMAGGIPIIASEVKGLKEVVEDAGLLFPSGDDSILAECIKSILSDKEVYQQLTLKGMKKAEKYSIKATAAKYKKLYLTLLKA